jgi:hypothetical protein
LSSSAIVAVASRKPEIRISAKRGAPSGYAAAP